MSEAERMLVMATLTILFAVGGSMFSLVGVIVVMARAMRRQLN